MQQTARLSSLDRASVAGPARTVACTNRRKVIAAETILFTPIYPFVIPRLLSPPRPRRRIHPPLHKRPPQRVPHHRIRPYRILHQPLLDLPPHRPQNLLIPRKRRHLRLQQPRRIRIQTLRHALQPIQPHPQRRLLPTPPPPSPNLNLPPARIRPEQRPNLRKRNKHRDTPLPRQRHRLKRQIKRRPPLDTQPPHQRVHHRPQHGGERRPCHGVQLKHQQPRQHQPPLEPAIVHVPQQPEGIQRGGGSRIVRDDGLRAVNDVIANRSAMRPAEDRRAEALVGEAARRVGEGVGGGLEVDEVGVDGGGRRRRGGGLVRVVQGGEAAEAGLDVALRGGEGDAQVVVEGRGLAEVVVGFVQGVEEVEGYDEDVDAPAVFGEAGGAGLGLGVAGADGDAVVEGLGPACDELGGGLSVGRGEGGGGGGEGGRTLGRKVQPKRERRPDIAAVGLGVQSSIGHGGMGGVDPGILSREKSHRCDVNGTWRRVEMKDGERKAGAVAAIHRRKSGKCSRFVFFVVASWGSGASELLVPLQSSGSC